MYRALRSRFIAAMILVACFGTPALAAESFDVINFDPTVDGIHYFTVSSARTLPQKAFALGLHFDFSRNALQRQNVATGKIGSQTSNLLVANLLWAYGITDWWGVGFNVPVVPVQTYYDPIAASPKGEQKSWLGDVRLESKLKLLSLEEYRVGIALIPNVTLPTGQSDVIQPDGTTISNVLGNGSTAGGARLVFEFQPVDPLVFALNTGYVLHKNVQPWGLGFELDDVITYGFGANARLTQWLSFVTEVTGFTLAKDFFGNEFSTPVEAGGGLRFEIPVTDGRLYASVGGAFGLDSGYGTPDWRTHMGLSYSLGGEAPTPDVAMDVQPERALYAALKDDQIVIMEPVLFSLETHKILPISDRVLEDLVDILKENPHLLLVRIEGHMDPMRSEKEALRVSRYRANEVRDFLIIRGIDPERLLSIGYGSSRPIADNETEEGRAQNRRIELVILKRAPQTL